MTHTAPPSRPPVAQIEVIAPNLKRRLSGVTATIVRLVPVQAALIGIAVTGPGLPAALPRVPLWRLPLLPRDRWRVWHARRNTEMLLGLVLRHLFRRRLRLLFTSASQRHHSRYSRWLIARMDRVIATSQRGAAYLRRCDGVIMHGIDTTAFAPPADRARLRAALGLPDGVLIGAYGRIRPSKGTDTFVEAMIATLPARPGVTALVMGRATERFATYFQQLQTRVAAAGLDGRILFLPEVPVDRMADWYRVLDLYVAPSRHEGFGLTPLEAMACGVPVLATRAGAYEDIITDDRIGALVPPGDAAAMAAAAADWLDDAGRRATGGLAARAHVEQGFRLQDEAAALVRLYRAMLAT